MAQLSDEIWALADAYAMELDPTPLTAELLDSMFGPRASWSEAWCANGEATVWLGSAGFVFQIGRSVRHSGTTLGHLRTYLRIEGIQPTNTEPTNGE